MIFLLVFFSMAVKDVFATGQIMFVAKGRRLLAGMADGFGDLANLLSLGLGAVEVGAHGWSVSSLLVGVALFCGSVVGTEIGSRLASLVPEIDLNCQPVVPPVA